MEWRTAQDTDLTTLLSWVDGPKQCLLWAGGKVTFPLDTARLAREIEFSPQNAWCLCAAETLLGFGQILRRAPERAHLARLIVSPDQRGLGYGAALCEHLLDTARRWSDCEIATLNVYRDNRAACSLYRRMGFQPVELAISELRDPQVLLMVRALRGGPMRLVSTSRNGHAGPEITPGQRAR